MKDTKIQWHPGFVAAMNLELAQNRADLIGDGNMCHALMEIMEPMIEQEIQRRSICNRDLIGIWLRKFLLLLI